MSTVIVVGFLVAVVGSVVLLLLYALHQWLMSRKRWQQFRDELSFSGEEDGRYRLTTTHRGNEVELRYDPGGRYRRSKLRLQLKWSFEDVPTGTLRTEKWYDVLAKSAGLSREIQIRRNEFDRNVYIESEDEGFEALAQHSGLTDRIRSLLEEKARSVTIGPEGLTLTIQAHLFWWSKLTARRLQTLIEDLHGIGERIHELSDSLPSRSPSTAATAPGAGTVQIILSGGGFLGLIAGGAMLWLSTNSTPFSSYFTWWGLKWSAGILLLMVVVGFFSMRGSSTSHKQLMGVLVLGAIGVPTLLIGTARYTNARLDTSRPVWLKASVIRIESDEDDIEAHLSVTEGRYQGQPEVTVSREMAEKLKRNGRGFVRVHDGYWNVPWISKIRVSRR